MYFTRANAPNERNQMSQQVKTAELVAQEICPECDSENYDAGYDICEECQAQEYDDSCPLCARPNCLGFCKAL